MRHMLSLCALAVLSGCVAYNVDTGDGIARAGIGKTVEVADFSVTPLEVLEDSRCPSDVQCVWAGRLRLKARIDFNDSVTNRELTLGEAQPVGNGMLKLVEANPYPEQDKMIYPEDYRFGFSYVPNIMQ